MPIVTKIKDSFMSNNNSKWYENSLVDKGSLRAKIVYVRFARRDPRNKTWETLIMYVALIRHIDNGLLVSYQPLSDPLPGDTVIVLGETPFVAVAEAFVYSPEVKQLCLALTDVLAVCVNVPREPGQRFRLSNN